ncbi:MAG: class I SAM-dependent methyltransferase [Solirubrobacteraceae bacterium]
MSSGVIWHDLECGGYGEDLALWRSLAAAHGTPVLDVGAGTGRVSLNIAAAGRDVIALDSDELLLAELAARGSSLPLQTVLADARSFALNAPVPLCIVPMQTIQLLGGRAGRLAFLRCARASLRRGGVLAIAIAVELEPFDAEAAGFGPVPDICERDGVVYSSLPTAVRVDGEAFVLERRRETVDTHGQRTAEHDLIRLDKVNARELEREGRIAGFSPAGRELVPATRDYVGSEVVILRA